MSWVDTKLLAGSGGASRYSFDLQNGAVSSNLANSSSKLSLGACYFDPSVISAPTGKTKHVYLEAILATTDASYPAYLDVFVVATGLVVASAQVSTPQLGPTFVSAELPTLVSAAPGVYQARLWMNPQDAGRLVTCLSAALVLKLL